MEFLLATSEFEIRGHCYEGFPILKANHDVFVEGMEFLVHHCLKRGSVQRSRGSWETFGRDLCDYFEFIEANGFDWKA